MTRVSIYFFAAVQMMVSTWPEYNAYGPAERHCTRVVANYCQRLESSESTKKDVWRSVNPACYPNVTTGYKGCLDGAASCSFPSPQHNMTCEQGALFQGCDVSPEACSAVDDRANSLVSVIGSKYWNVPMCQRRACVDNVKVDWWETSALVYDGSTMFAVLETLFLGLFWFEYLLRMYIARSLKKFFQREYVSLIFVLLLTFEYVSVLVARQSFVYDPWGLSHVEAAPFPFRVDAHSLRILRLLVPARFVWITSDFKGIHNLIETMVRVSGRLVPFLFVFAICLIFFSFAMFYAEIIHCNPMLIDGRYGEGSKVWRYLKADGETDCKIQDMADAFWLVMVTLTSVG